ncbi:Uncharacterised protein [Kluyvera cryocrescens]|uniref:Uncharacterized protein n=1 Tax=Kluyvera cryocrescens TaxID=580 RepID=A0A485CF70_KLUCR|nr:Uncharacterised protein [Kluyvera cryocrescens]
MIIFRGIFIHQRTIVSKKQLTANDKQVRGYNLHRLKTNLNCVQK